MMMLKKNKIYCGDCRNVMKDIPANSIAGCITDPPYNYEFIGRNWDEKEITRRLNKIKESKTLVKNIPYGSGLAGGVRNQRWYEKNRMNIEEYVKWSKQWGEELFRICKAGSPVAVFNSARTIAHIQIALESVGFYTRDIIVYRRSSGIPKGLNLYKKLKTINHPETDKWSGWHSCFRNEWEAILVTQKPLLKNYWETIQKTGVGLFKTENSDGSFQSNIFDGFSSKNEAKEFEHCTVKPLKLIKKLIDTLIPLSKSNVVLDPFAGSGTTLVAAKEMGYDFIGIEIEKKYIPLINKRLSRTKMSKK